MTERAMLPLSTASRTSDSTASPGREGDAVDGHIAEVDSYHFNWFVLDEENLAHYLNDERFDQLESDVNVAASKLRFRVPNDGPWFLLLDASGKQFARQVEVHLRTL